MTRPPDASGIALKGGLILTDAEEPVVRSHGWTIATGEWLLDVNAPQPPFGETPGTVLDCSGCIVIPGLVNAHTHGAMSLLRGLADDLPLDRWLNEYIFPAEARHVDPDFVYLGTLLSAAEMALNGVTTFADGYFHMEQAAHAAIEVGLRAVVAQGILDVPAPDTPAGGWRARVEDYLSNVSDHSLISPALFCHSPYLCGPETLTQVRALCTERSIPLFVHVAESAWELEEIRERHGRSPVEHLAGLGLLGEGLIAVHCVHVSEYDRTLLADSGTGVVHCPESNLKLASGAADVTALMNRGIHVALGTDGAASNNNLELFEEMRTASLLAKLVTGDPQALDCRSALRMATIDGARILGMADRIGSLQPGKLADLVAVNLNSLHCTPLYDPISHLVYSAGGSDVRHVVVNGRVLVRDGRLETIDEADLLTRARARGRAIAQDLGLSVPSLAE